jgi:hypothetical protein
MVSATRSELPHLPTDHSYPTQPDGTTTIPLERGTYPIRLI